MEICFEVGFKEISHFSKAYKATYGIPPTEDAGEVSRLVELYPGRIELYNKAIVA